MARYLAKGLGEKGYVTVSGLARGVDTAANIGALETGTVAVMAGGVDVLYPAENAKFGDDITDQDARISEQPMGLPPRARHFPARNRLISGLCRGVIIVEAAAKSGSLITARDALDQGHEVLAVPGHPFDARAAGCNMLLRDGAVLVRNIDDVMQVLNTAENYSTCAEQVLPVPQNMPPISRQKRMYCPRGVYVRPPFCIRSFYQSSTMRQSQKISWSAMSEDPSARCLLRW